MRKFFLGAALLAAIFSCGWTNAACRADEPGGDRASGQPDAIALMSVRGQVVDPQRRPRAGARVILRTVASRVRAEVGILEVADKLAETRTDSEGKFAFDDVPLSSSFDRIVELLRQGRRAADIIALADGFSLGWAPLYAVSTVDPVKVALQPAAAVEGVVVNEQDMPLAGAEVEVIGVSHPDSAKDGLLEFPENLNLIFSSLRPRARTDDAGRFRIENLPGDHLVSIWATHPDYPRQYLVAAIGEHVAPQTLVGERGDDERETRVQVNPVKLSLRRGPRVVVRVTDQHGKPVGGGRVALMRSGEWAAGRTAADGTLRMAVSEPSDYSVMYLPPEGRGGLFLNRSVTLTNADIETQHELQITLPQPQIIEGRVIGQGTSEGLADIQVYWSTAKSETDRSDTASAATRSDAQGRFRVKALAGKGWLRCSGTAPGFFVVDVRSARGSKLDEFSYPVEVPETGLDEPVEIQVSRGLVIRGTVLDASGAAASGILVGAVSRRDGSQPGPVITDREGRFELAGLHPRDSYSISAMGDGLVAFGAVEGKADQPLTVSRLVTLQLRLEPAVTLSGRVLSGGEPLAGVRLTLSRGAPIENGMLMNSVSTAVTGDDGRYRLSGLQPGDSYDVDVKPPFSAIDPVWRDESQLPSDAEGEVSLPDINLRRLNQSLAGVVVDPDGKPVEGVTVSAQLPGGASSLSSTSFGPPPWTETNRNGRFRLSQLPDMPLELMAYIEPEGENREIRFPAKVKTTIGQQDVRIVLDPSLAEEE